MKQLLQKMWNNKNILYYAVPFVLMDLLIKFLFFKKRTFQIWWPSAWLFSLLWIALFGFIIYSLKGIVRIIVYWLLFIIFFVLMLTNGIYYFKTDYFFDFSLIKMTNEGSEYIWDTIVSASIWFYLASAAILIITVVISLQIKKVKNIRISYLLIAIVVFVVMHLGIPRIVLGEIDDTNWQTKRNIYNNCTDANQSIELSGLYEYSVRNFYVSLIKGKEKPTKKQLSKLDYYYKNKKKNKHNSYTGLLKDKNVIFLQFEGLDSWLLNKKDTPHIYDLKEHSVSFDNHFTMYTGGGSTFNSELASNTGFVQPLSTNEFACWYYTNKYKETMPALFKKNNYDVNAFHMNDSTIYYRGLNYDNWGYNHYYGLKDIDKRVNNYGLDRYLVSNHIFNNKLFNHKGKKFVDYIITYTPHMPFDMSNKSLKFLVKEKHKDVTKKYSEEELSRIAASETDYMVELLLKELKKKNLYDKTAIVAFTDHYLYSLEDKSILNKYKKTDNNLINKTPFFIWSKDIEKKNINKVTMQANLLPTVLNLFGIDFNENFYIGKDALAPDYKGVAFFPDYSWYDGNIYVKDKRIVNKAKASQKYIEEKDDEVQDMINKNDLTLKYNYFEIKEKRNN